MGVPLLRGDLAVLDLRSQLGRLRIFRKNVGDSGTLIIEGYVYCPSIAHQCLRQIPRLLSN
jgi:hypothetical protein